MQESVFTIILLPLVLAIIMFGMGLSLQTSDFSRLAKMPKPIFIGLVGQLLVLPLLAFSIAVLFKAPEEVAIGLMILAACPGGTTSNLFAHLAKANLALSISLTAITTVICVFTTPWLIAFSIDYFTDTPPPEFSLLQTSLGLIVITLIPVLLGMVARAYFSQLAIKAEPWFRRASVAFMILLIIKITYDESDSLLAGFPDMYVLTISLNLLATLLGVFLAKLFLLKAIDGVTLGIEIGTQNATLAILIAISFVQNPAYAIVGGTYGVLMYLGASLLVLHAKRIKQKQSSSVNSR
jgi:BASS family bile acid:Na+ symporter